MTPDTKQSRRRFMHATLRTGAAASLVGAWASGDRLEAAEAEESQSFFRVLPIGQVQKQGTTVQLRIFDAYVDGLLGLEGWSHVNVFYWFDRNDTVQQRRILQVHPRANPQNPLTGVFACRAPVRPNLIALSVGKILAVQGNLITLDQLDAFEGTPVLDLKPFIPPDAPTRDVRVPPWASRGRPSSSQ